MSVVHERSSKRRKLDKVENNYTVGHRFDNISVEGSVRAHFGDLHYGDVKFSEEERCCQVFKTSTYEDFKDRNPLRAEGTCQWVLAHPQYCQWRQNDQSDLLWISADPGCGKSVLARSLVDGDLLVDDQDPATVCHFFFKDNDEQDNLATALCALLHQLFVLRPDLIRYALPMYKQNGKSLQRETREMWRILQQAASDPTSPPVICVLDALDECQDRDRELLISLLKEVYQLPDNRPARSTFKILVTSRPYSNIERGFHSVTSHWPHIRLRGEDENEEIHQEINLVIAMQVEELAEEFSLSQTSRERLLDQLLGMRHRTYLWLHLVMDEIRITYENSLYLDEVVIDTLPDSVEAAYERMLQKIDQRQVPHARQILLILVGARRPLQVGEMALALGAAKAHHEGVETLLSPKVQHLEKQIRQWCGLFIYIQQGTLFLIHQTAKEFLLSASDETECPDKSWRGSISTVKMELEMVKLCTKYLSLLQTDVNQLKTDYMSKAPSNVKTTSEQRNYTNDFFEYCAEYWVSHYQEHTLHLAPELLDRILMLYDDKSDLFSVWSTVFRIAAGLTVPSFPVSSQHVAAFNGHTSILALLSKPMDPDLRAQDGRYRDTLRLAAIGGHVDTVDWLLGQGVEVDVLGGEWSGTALQYASIEGQEQMVRLLLERGADVNAYHKNIGTSLEAASTHGFVEVVQLLIDNGADVDKGGQISNPLLEAVQGGHEEIVQLLLDAGADPNAEAGKNRSALWEALQSDQTQIALLLLANGADIDGTTESNYSALQLASAGGHESLVRWLLVNGANINTRRWDVTALEMALGNGHQHIVQLLLEKGSQANRKAQETLDLSLQIACASSNEKIVRQLLDEGADVNAGGGYYGGALQAASAVDGEGIVQLLLERGADIDIEDKDDVPALWWASSRGHKRIVELLLDKGADVDAQGGLGNALEAASHNGHSQIVQLLLKRGAKPLDET